ncbi:hypothetical protein HETIRDRAFT_105686 [Heterobasidion irregulare TC 32-1]|uniref:Reverse transcriptase/retrotransposon-derived protein RNase H-like domain-containing protein n=1 Tax=Heterobasidion irregulare (strain TC 32-1) TaxID=747525 RepID=W4JW51_HETIT|nr:uncharacterized protein HETIRDRAFT_105686 [Heterobasidion irregulare TC 32-1]ETW77116.1 hypothetical protein HETIRDRAFT_105686 [Heterobasidion irregulare TC 32-1]
MFGPDQIAAQDDLWSALLELPALRPIDYGSAANVILTINTSQIAVGFHLCQCALNNPRVRYYAQFGSITLNDHESQFSQPKLKLYGLFRALQSLKMYLIGVQNLILEVDAHYIKDDFDDWIDNLYGFLHQINNTFPTSNSTSTTTIFTSSLIGDLPTEADSDDEGPTVDYSDIPSSQKALEAEERLWLVRDWHQTLVRPPSLSNSEYATFLQYCTEFFIAANKLWRKDSHG